MSEGVFPVDVRFVLYEAVDGYVFLPGRRFPSVSIIPPMLHADIPVCAIDPVCSTILIALLSKPLQNILILTVFNSLNMIKIERNLSEMTDCVPPPPKKTPNFNISVFFWLYFVKIFIILCGRGRFID
jgi:hypothetical protein